MERTSRHHFGLSITLLFGIFTALAATVALVAERRSATATEDHTDSWDGVLGI